MGGISFNIKEVNMEELTFDKMYKKSDTQGLSYEDWLTNEQKKYKSKVDSGKLESVIPFPAWMIMRHYKGLLNADANSAAIQEMKDQLAAVKKMTELIKANEALKKSGTTSSAERTQMNEALKEGAENLQRRVVSAAKTATSPELSETLPEGGTESLFEFPDEYLEEKKILGMKPVIFWSAAAVTVITASIIIFKVIKKK